MRAPNCRTVARRFKLGESIEQIANGCLRMGCKRHLVYPVKAVEAALRRAMLDGRRRR